jgi:hypothetical protein
MSADPPTLLRRRRRRIRLWAAAALALPVLALLVPERAVTPPAPAGGQPFAWRQDAVWRGLQGSFEAARARGCPALAGEVAAGLARCAELTAAVAGRPLPPDAAAFADLERAIFAVGPAVAACPHHLPAYAEAVTRGRAAVKDAARAWNLGESPARDRLYRLLYGSRAALEEAMLQAPTGTWPALVRGVDEPSRTPSAELLGVTVHSGDILVSRGGAPTSALIARASDYPGNFSHVAQLHVDEAGRVSIVEAHIERGVAVATPEAYLADVKLRVMVLRPRADLAALRADPLLPHRAATWALAEARRRHIPYDFAMDASDPDRLFCSEVASAAYRHVGVALWPVPSRISTPGAARWLAGFGVGHLETQEPSDLELDPQLVVVAEWREAGVLFKDHLDNAVTDALLEHAETGRGLGYDLGRLPLARIAKAVSLGLNLVGRVGPVPEGMSPATALRAERLRTVHGALAARVAALAEEFRARRGYRPPTWELVALARAACAEQRCAERL